MFSVSLVSGNSKSRRGMSSIGSCWGLFVERILEERRRRAINFSVLLMIHGGEESLSICFFLEPGL